MTEHLTDTELRNYTTGVLPADDLLRIDDHLSGCGECRGRAAALSGAATRVDAFRSDLAAPTMHLSEEEMQLAFQGKLPAGTKDALLRHLNECPVCCGQVEDLRAWAAPQVRARPNTRWLAIAAGIVLALIPAALWKAGVGRQSAPTSLAGIEALNSQEQARVQAALNAGAAELPDFAAEISSTREVLMGAKGKGNATFVLLSPVGTGTVSDRPRFEWQPLRGAEGYTITVFDERSNVVARSPIVREVNWTPTDPLPRDRTYVWQVSTPLGRETITAPAAPAPPARFHVIDMRSAQVLSRTLADHPDSHLLLGILNMNAGVLDAAIQHLQQVSASDIHAAVAQRSLERLRALNPPEPPR